MLNAMGVSAPHNIRLNAEKETISLDSSDPFSLYNALRCAVGQAENNQGYWKNSNWSNKFDRADSIFMMSYFENEIDIFKYKLKKIQPNILFIGAMTLSYRGAVELACIAKEMLGDNVFVVLGGKHVNETLFERNGTIVYNKASPLNHMNDLLIPKIFDLIVSGDGEMVIAAIGSKIGELVSKNKGLNTFYDEIEDILKAPGDYLLGWTNSNSTICLKSKGDPIDYNSLPLVSALFPISSNFDVFNSDITAHSFSDISRGCVHSCFYCSENAKINGKLKMMDSAPERLIKQFNTLVDTGLKEYNTTNVSAFVEDSILLGGNIFLLDKFCNLLKKNDINIKFGAQLTVDNLMNEEIRQVVLKLKDNGLVYVFVGIETGNEIIAKTMQKNRSSGTWIDKNEVCMTFLTEANLNCGVSVLFGLGESQQERLELIKCISKWRIKYGIPRVISLNWAVQHPLQMEDEKVRYDYLQWGTPSFSPYLNILGYLFGEASVNYCLPGIQMASIEELVEIKELISSFYTINNSELCLAN